jgi:hypothetical protein
VRPLVSVPLLRRQANKDKFAESSGYGIRDTQSIASEGTGLPSAPGR